MKTFEELDLMTSVQRALTDENYETPTPIQAQTVPAAIRGRDVLGCAQTGTGKTAAYAIPILNRLAQRNRKARPNRPFVLVLAPTRELAIQIGESFATYGRHLRLRYATVYGGVGQGSQVRALTRGAHILVATPGRLIDLMNQGHIELDSLEMFVLDEADRMLDMGFLPDLRRIINELPDDRQSLFFSATLPSKIVELSRRLLSNPVSVNVTPKSTSVDKIQQRVLFVERSGKRELLRQILKGRDVDRVLVFTRTKRAANGLVGHLMRSGVKAAAIHGNKSQSARQRALEAFRRNQVQVLVATDVAARGIDIDGITHVINFDLPVEPEAYVHRIGRTGRAGAEGIALSFCSAGERRELRAIERLIGQEVARESVPASPDTRRNQQESSPRGQRETGSQRQVRKGLKASRPAVVQVDDGSAKASKPKQQRRPQRQRRHRRQRAKQTT